eukprot:gnl/TRDRNA2_/TRDRNA2_81436_c0_seq1.p1 gnl/TRDRNA2_/TRDRNA2_81436_c0~~gnl/TRDRNA2_/TRDRNA2_81436_c0_seq1.p1  ORF type:complete len:299 (-),score=92.63 gnl/TRDRNA2_/TRDRNA2_81436_c0_seq1:265-1068(-)
MGCCIQRDAEVARLTTENLLLDGTEGDKPTANKGAVLTYSAPGAAGTTAVAEKKGKVNSLVLTVAPTAVLSIASLCVSCPRVCLAFAFVAIAQLVFMHESLSGSWGHVKKDIMEFIDQFLKKVEEEKALLAKAVHEVEERIHHHQDTTADTIETKDKLKAAEPSENTDGPSEKAAAAPEAEPAAKAEEGDQQEEKAADEPKAESEAKELEAKAEAEASAAKKAEEEAQAAAAATANQAQEEVAAAKEATTEAEPPKDKDEKEGDAAA